MTPGPTTDPPAGGPPVPIDLRGLSARHDDGAILASRLAHSFDNVLTGVVGFAELSCQMAVPGTPVAEYLAEVLRAAQQGMVLTQQMHQFNRAATATVGPAWLAVVLADEQARLAGLLPPGLRLVIEAAADLGPLAIGMGPLQQLLVHLLDNAREATRAGTIRVQAGPAAPDGPESTAWLTALGPGPFAEIVISDTGTGLSAETAQRLATEPFYSTRPRHTGLGLATVSRILQAHHGGLRLSSVPGQGCQARVYLPIMAGP